jgi:hypothetical protein
VSAPAFTGYVRHVRESRRVILWRGASPTTGAPIMAVGVSPGASANTKTGPMVQTYVLPADRDPVLERRDGNKRATCGDCPLACGGCYVRAELGPMASWRAAHDGAAVDLSRLRDVAPAFWRRVVSEFGRGRAVRIGSDGDPAMIPVEVWRALVRRAEVWTGYTHQTAFGGHDGWTAPHARQTALRSLSMASTTDPASTRAAWRAGWRTYRARPVGAPLLRGEIDCPASRGTTCADCGLCSGVGGRAAGAPSISIEVHGG